MKATGIVRRIDDLGRVVIPKEIRRTMRIREGDPLEIYTSAEGEVIFRKYSALGEMSESAAQVAEIIGRLSGCPVVIFDRDQVIAVSGIPKKELLNRRVSQELCELMEARRQYFGTNAPHIRVIEGEKRTAIACLPILTAGDVTGAVAFLDSGDASAVPTELQNSLITAASQFLGRQMEG